jgi:hypothetical protein
MQRMKTAIYHNKGSTIIHLNPLLKMIVLN